MGVGVPLRTDIDDEMAPRVVTLAPTDALLGCPWTVLSGSRFTCGELSADLVPTVCEATGDAAIERRGGDDKSHADQLDQSDGAIDKVLI